MNTPAQIGRYEILRTLGRGSMGCVYLALDPNIDRQVALKVLEPSRQLSSSEEDELRKRFILEAKATGRMSHPGIVTIHDAETDAASGHSYIAMEFIEGSSLLDLLQESGKLPPSRAIAIVAEVALALQAAHDAGLVHRDIKPANLIMSPEGHPKITDFGIAKFSAASHTVIGAVLGTPYYMSPEQVRGEVLDGRSDLFSLGVVLYQCLAGELPFEGETLTSIAYMVNEVDPRPLRSLNPDLSPALCEVVDRALQKPAESRFQSGAQFAKALRSVEGTVAPASMTVPAAPRRATSTSASGTMIVPPPGSGVRRWSGSRRTKVGMAALLGIVVAALLLIWVRGGQPPEPAEPVQGPELIDQVFPSVTPAETAAAGESSEARGGLFSRFLGAEQGEASLRITHKNRLQSATISVWVDGEMLWSRSMSVARRKLRERVAKKVSGQRVETLLTVTEGEHTIEVEVFGSTGKVKARDQLTGWFDDGQTRSLEVVLIPPRKLSLSWE